MKYWKLSCVLCCAIFIVFAVIPAAGEILSIPTNSSTDGEVTKQNEKGIMPSNPPSSTVVTIPQGTGGKAEERKPDVIEPLFVRTLVTVESGRNDSNPRWSPQGTLIAFERSVGDNKEIRITLADGTPVQSLNVLLSDGGGEMKLLFPGLSDETSYNAGIAWSPDESRFVFMSNGGIGNYDIYLQDLGASESLRLTDHKEKDGQAQWSHRGNSLLFVSGRTGNGDVYLLDLRTRALTRLTYGGNAYLYPCWSSDDQKIVMMHGSNENHNIVLISDIKNPVESRRALTAWPYDDLRPVWSPDGKKIAFYSNYNSTDDSRIWSLFVIAADGSDPREGDGLAAKAIATDIIPDIEAGPSWMPDSKRIVFVKNDRQEYNPLYIADIDQKKVSLIKTDTKMNHDVAISADGTIAFRAQVNQWDQIFIMKLRNEGL